MGKLSIKFVSIFILVVSDFMFNYLFRYYMLINLSSVNFVISSAPNEICYSASRRLLKLTVAIVGLW